MFANIPKKYNIKGPYVLNSNICETQNVEASISISISFYLYHLLECSWNNNVSEKTLIRKNVVWVLSFLVILLQIVLQRLAQTYFTVINQYKFFTRVIQSCMAHVKDGLLSGVTFLNTTTDTAAWDDSEILMIVSDELNLVHIICRWPLTRFFEPLLPHTIIWM